MVALNIFGLLRLAVALLCINFVAAGTLDVWSPSIQTPTKGATWFTGQDVTVTWDTSDAPAQITSPGRISLHLKCGDPIDVAEGFDLRTGSVTFKLADNLPLGPAFFVLFGSSDNYSNVVVIN